MWSCCLFVQKVHSPQYCMHNRVDQVLPTLESCLEQTKLVASTGMKIMFSSGNQVKIFRYPKILTKSGDQPPGGVSKIYRDFSYKFSTFSTLPYGYINIEASTD